MAPSPSATPVPAPAVIADQVVEALRACAVPARRDHSARYYPTALEVLGVPVPDIRHVLRPVADLVRAEPSANVLDLAHALCATNVHEARQLAWELVGNRPDVIAGLDALELERLGRGNDNWATVDGFAVHVTGPAWRDGPVHDADVLRWARNPDRWWRRTALVSTVALNVPARGGHGDAARTMVVCEVLCTDADPMVTKALSWAMRALVDVDRRAVAAFLLRRGAGVPALVRREVGNKLATGLKSGEERA